jgi:hypothetical protein
MFTDARIGIAYRAKCPTKRASASAKQSCNRTSYRSSLHHDPALSKTRRAERRADEKTLVKQALAGTDLREHLDEPAVLRLLNQFDSYIRLIIHLIVGVDRNSVAYPSRSSDWIVFSAAAPPTLPGARHQAKCPCWLQPITVPGLNLEKVELPSRNGAYQGFKMALGGARTASGSTGRPAPVAGPSYSTTSASCSHPATLKSKAPSVPST